MTRPFFQPPARSLFAHACALFQLLSSAFCSRSGGEWGIALSVVYLALSLSYFQTHTQPLDASLSLHLRDLTSSAALDRVHSAAMCMCVCSCVVCVPACSAALACSHSNSRRPLDSAGWLAALSRSAGLRLRASGRQRRATPRPIRLYAHACACQISSDAPLYGHTT